MSRSTLLFDLGCRNSFICRSCLVNLRKEPPKPPIFRTYIGASRQTRHPRPAAPGKTQAAAVPKLTEDDSSTTVRFFEQGNDGRIRQFRSGEDFAESWDQEVESQLDELEGKLRETARLVEKLNKKGARRQADKLRTKYRIVEDEEEKQDRSQPDLPKIDDNGLAARARRHVANLNSVLRPAAKKLRRNKLDRTILSAVWGRYGVARPALAESWDNVPPEVWDCLWDILSVDSPTNKNRMAHIYVLAKDMQAADVPLTDRRQLLVMEAMFIEGWQKEAIENWRRSVGTLGGNSETSRDYWELGIRMCSLAGDLERAERAVDTLFEQHPDANPRVLFQLIRMAAAKQAKSKAWNAYLRLRDLLGPSMQIEDYDEVVSCFLSAGQTWSAFHVFVDMMYSGAIDLTGKTRLPQQVANSFFFGKWLKRLIGAGDLDGAHSVLKFMQANGIMPAAIQVNGLIGAWLRSNTAENQQRADDLAWAMIQSRRVFVDLRRRQAALEWPLKLYTSSGPSHSKEGEDGDTLTFVPKATLETYSLMAENYKNRGLRARLEELWVTFKESEIATDAFMMNQLLESYVQDGKAEEAREMYTLMTRDNKLVPDAQTFLVMYKSLAVNRLLWLSLSDAQKDSDALLCRQLLADMAGWSWVLGSQSDRFIFPFLSRTILHTFRKVEDHVGLIVALRVLRKVSGFSPTPAFATKMIMESAVVNRDTPSLRRRTAKAADTLQFVLAKRREAAAKQGELVLNETDELCAVMELHYRRKVDVSDEEFHQLYIATARDMGVYDILSK